MSKIYDDLVKENRRKSRLLLAGAFVMLLFIIWLVAGLVLGPDLLLDPVLGLAVAAVGATLGLGLTYLSYRSGPALALRSAGARPVSRSDAPDLHRLLDEVCVSAGLTDRPTLHIVDDPAPNAFATGLSLADSHVAVTTGLVQRLPRYELRAVLAHEVAHIVNDDVRTVTVAVATAGLVALLADIAIRATYLSGRSSNRDQNGLSAVLVLIGILAAILAPVAARLIRFSVSRQREYLADATAAQILRDPQSMVDALRRLELDGTHLKRFESANAHLWFEEPNSLEGSSRSSRMARRFATHPTLRQRVERLSQLNAGTVDPDRPLRSL